MKNLIKTILSNRVIREFFKLSWNPYYDYTFHDVAKTFDQAVKKINENKKFKNYEEIFKFLDKELESINKIGIDKGDIHSLLPILVSSINNSNSKSIDSILDIGGGVNPISFYIKKYTNYEIKSCVLEVESYTKKLNQITRNINYLNYFSNLNEINKKNFDLVYFGSSLQYFQDTAYEFLEKTLNYDPKWVIITRNFFVDGDEDIYSLQSNGRYHLIPHKFFSKSKMLNFFNKKNFKLIFETKHDVVRKHKKMNNSEFSYQSLFFKNRNIN
tara:strand:- start:30 stop:842 length:813 start_codon:yes stop_codon:yes gene_type:complete